MTPPMFFTSNCVTSDFTHCSFDGILYEKLLTDEWWSTADSMQWPCKSSGIWCCKNSKQDSQAFGQKRPRLLEKTKAHFRAHNSRPATGPYHKPYEINLRVLKYIILPFTPLHPSFESCSTVHSYIHTVEIGKDIRIYYSNALWFIMSMGSLSRYYILTK
jgi:hypothetical protein